LLTKLLILFILVPAVELILLIQIGQLIGTLPTIALIIFTGALGAFLARRQGGRVLTRMRTDFQTGQLPADSIFDGAIILVAGAFLMTPGILTDTVGFLCLIPVTRGWIKRLIWSRMQSAIRGGQVQMERSYGTDNRYEDNYRTEPEDIFVIDHDDFK
jgi:UPF0716 protein FxsA